MIAEISMLLSFAPDAASMCYSYFKQTTRPDSSQADSCKRRASKSGEHFSPASIRRPHVYRLGAPPERVERVGNYRRRSSRPRMSAAERLLVCRQRLLRVRQPLLGAAGRDQKPRELASRASDAGVDGTERCRQLLDCHAIKWLRLPCAPGVAQHVGELATPEYDVRIVLPPGGHAD